jgi:hypothetical protein
MPISQNHHDFFHSPGALDQLNLFQSLLDAGSLTSTEALALLNTIHTELEKPGTHDHSVYTRYAEVMESLRVKMPEIYADISTSWQNLRSRLQTKPDSEESAEDGGIPRKNKISEDVISKLPKRIDPNKGADNRGGVEEQGESEGEGEMEEAEGGEEKEEEGEEKEETEEGENEEEEEEEKGGEDEEEKEEEETEDEKKEDAEENEEEGEEKEEAEEIEKKEEDEKEKETETETEEKEEETEEESGNESSEQEAIEETESSSEEAEGMAREAAEAAAESEHEEPEAESAENEGFMQLPMDDEETDGSLD